MSFTIDAETLLIKGRRGDSGSFLFAFSEPVDEYIVDFYVKKNPGDSDDKAVLKKTYYYVADQMLEVVLTPGETEKFLTPPDTHTQYFWGLKIHNGNDFAQTLIPSGFKTPPVMCIYPAIGGVR